MIKAVIFDLDGTLCYTINDLRTAMNCMLREKGYPEMDFAGIYSAINYGSREFVRRCLPEGVGDDEELLTECHRCYSSHYDKHYLDTTYPYEGIVDIISYLKKENIRVACLSNKADNHVKAIIEKLFPETFDIALGNCERFPTKPNPASALWIAEQLKVDTNEVLYIGDSNIDMMTGRNAKFFTCGVTWGYRDRDCLATSGAQVMIDRALEIKQIIERINNI